MPFFVVEITESRTVLVKAGNEIKARAIAFTESSSRYNSQSKTEVLDSYSDLSVAYSEHIIDVDLTGERYPNDFK